MLFTKQNLLLVDQHDAALTLKDRDSHPRLKITIVLKCLITFEPPDIAFVSFWIFRGSVAYMITSSHFDNIDWSEETNAFRPSEPNKNDCWHLVPPRAQIGSNVTYFNQ